MAHLLANEAYYAFSQSGPVEHFQGLEERKSAIGLETTEFTEVVSMLVVRYFGFVGAALMALLFVVSAHFPAMNMDRPDVSLDKTTIRIASRRVGPELVKIDTSQTMMGTVPTTQAHERQTSLKQIVSPREAFARIDSTPIRSAVVRLEKKTKTKTSNSKGNETYCRQK
jgi:hypothetical protein